MSGEKYLAEITVYLGNAATTLNFTSGAGCNVGGKQYEGRITNPGSLKMMMFADGTTMGASQIGYGSLVLANTDGALDYLIDAGFSGRQLLIKQLIAGSAVLLMSCSMQQPTFDNTSLAILIKDPQIVLNVPVQPNKYGGSNSLPNGIDGTADIQGKPKPLLYGQVANASPTCVNTSRLIYQLHAGALQSISNVYDKGVALTFGTDRATNALLQSNPPAAGTYDTCLAEGLFRLGSSPFGQVTADAIQGATAADRTAAQIAKTVALKALTAGDLVTADFTALDTLNSAVIGIYITDETLIPAVLDEVLGSIGGWYGFDSAGKLNVGRLNSPAGTAEVTLTTYEIKELERLATQDEGRGLPVWKVNTGYNKNYTVQDAANLAGKSDMNWVTSALPSSQGWSSVAFGNGLFVGVGDGNGSGDIIAASSPDGVIWTQRVLPISGVWSSVAYGNGLFVAVTADNTGNAAISSDGISWVQKTLPVSNRWKHITYANGLFIAVGGYDAGGGTCATSPDGSAWTLRTLPAITYIWFSVTYGNGLFVTVSGGDNIAATSPDGITWTSRSLPSASYPEQIIFGNGLYVATNSGLNFITSPDGITWTKRTFPVGASFTRSAFGSNLFVIVGNNSSIILYSNDGISWAQGYIGSLQHWFSVGFGNGQFIALSYGGAVSSALRTAPEMLRSLYASKMYRVVNTSDAAVQTKYLTGSQELNINTLIVSASAAQTEATRQLNLRKVRRDYIAVKIKRSALSSIPDLGKMIAIQYPRYGYATGKLFVLIGFEMQLETDDLTLFLWG